ncbi:MAG: site-2 protease family protein, partial [Anaerolineales bacterium]|nr:site-2 protease family protein [Anaerolineales bacterium]
LAPPQHPISLDRATYLGAREVYSYVRTIVLLPVRMLSGQARPEESRLGGYKLMYDIYQRADPIWFFMMISASLGIMNLLPIPALDGGRILLTLPEIIFRKRVPPEYENAIHFVGFVLLLLLLVYINLQDFLNPIQLP